MLSHELRNPLAPIRNALEVIRRLAPAEPKLTWATDVTDRQVRQLTRLVDDLLDVARISQGKIVLQTEPLDLRAVVAHAIETRASRSSTAVATSCTTVGARTRRSCLRGDFARLVAGRRQPAQQRRQVHRRGRRDRAGADARARARRVISVRDNGIGIDAELLPHVFELFEQGKRSLDRSQGGLGVGLTLVQRLVGLHGGAVDGEQRRRRAAAPSSGSRCRA